MRRVPDRNRYHRSPTRSDFCSLANRSRTGRAPTCQSHGLQPRHHDGAPDVVPAAVRPDEVPVHGRRGGGGGRRRHRHREALLLRGRGEDELLRLHRHGRAAARHLHARLVRRGRLRADVGRRADHRLRLVAAVEHHRDGRVVKVGPRRLPARRGGARHGLVRDHLDRVGRVPDAAHERHVVLVPGVVHQPRVQGLAQRDVPRAVVERRRGAPGLGLVRHGAAAVVGHDGRGHQRRADGRRRPPGVRGPEQRGGATRVRARHGRPRQDVELRPPVVGLQAGWTGGARPRREDVDAGRDEVGLEDFRDESVRPARREGGHQGSRLDADDRAPEHNCCGRVGGVGSVRLERVALVLAHRASREDVGVPY
ncbi:hypothetical protein CFC21_062331 [Triticum aestivum]|uniref:Uncharacterized protein n=2 Tax=Triticum aestivum TaxID=4565 RepID=A0A9R1GXV0_WHEAT|nr:hypothetical protein CFC21_062331 [Triticum aestivum]